MLHTSHYSVSFFTMAGLNYGACSSSNSNSSDSGKQSKHYLSLVIKQSNTKMFILLD